MEVYREVEVASDAKGSSKKGGGVVCQQISEREGVWTSFSYSVGVAMLS